jgi:hypothetical protein
VVFHGVQGDSRHDLRSTGTGASGVNDDELARFLESGHGRAGAGGEPAPGAAADVRGLLADGTLWAEPASGGVEALLAAIEAEAEPEPTGGAGGRVVSGDRPVAPPRPSARHRHHRGLVLVSAAAAVVLLAGVVGVVGALRGGDDTGPEFAIGGTELAPAASAVATVEERGAGVAIELDVRGLPPAGEGTYYQAWLKSPDGLVSAGTFHMRGGDGTIELWSGVLPDRYPTLTVTLQREGAGQESSGQVVLTGRIDG